LLIFVALTPRFPSPALIRSAHKAPAGNDKECYYVNELCNIYQNDKIWFMLCVMWYVLCEYNWQKQQSKLY